MKVGIISGRLKGKRIDLLPVQEKKEEIKIDLSDIPSFLQPGIISKIKSGEILWA